MTLLACHKTILSLGVISMVFSHRRLLISAYNIIVVDKISSNAHHAIAVTHTCQNAWNQGEFLHWRPFWEWL